MPNVAVIFAGGSGVRMNNSAVPKQFLELYGKPIIVYTLEQFEKHPEIDFIIVACIRTHLDYMRSLVDKYNLLKVRKIVKGGKSGQESIFNALTALEQLVDNPNQTVVLIHDGGRPLVDSETISDNIKKVEEFGSCITCVPSIETVVVANQDYSLLEVPKRECSYLARAPQSFYLNEILKAHRKAIEEGRDTFVDSCSLMSFYGHQLGMIKGKMENIKITTPTDFYVFKAILDARENSKIFGLL